MRHVAGDVVTAGTCASLGAARSALNFTDMLPTRENLGTQDEAVIEMILRPPPERPA